MSDMASSDPNSMSVGDLLLVSIRNEGGRNPSHSQKDVFSVLHSRLPTMSVFELLQTLLATKHADFFGPAEIFTALRTKSGQPIGDGIDQWVAWFLGLSGPFDENIGSPGALGFDPGKDREKISIALLYTRYKESREFAEGIKGRPSFKEKKPEVRSLVSNIIDLECAGDFEGALALANELVKKYPNKPEAWATRGYMHLHKDDFAKAVADSRSSQSVGWWAIQGSNL